MTNVGILVFEEDNFMNPTRLIPLGQLKMEQIAQKVSGKPFSFKLSIGDSEELMLRAPDRPQFDMWIGALKELIEKAKTDPKSFKI